MTLVVGIDPSSKKLAMVMSQSKKGSFSTNVKKLSQDHTLACGQAYEHVYELLGELMDDVDEEVHVYMEAPIMGMGGAHPTIVQSQIGGAVMAAVSRRHTPLTLVNNQSWKKRICGRGNINKAEVVERMTEVWPDLVEFAGKDQDLIDAGAVNLFGWHVLTLRKRLGRKR